MFVETPFFTVEAADMTESDQELAASKIVTYTKYYTGNITPPATYDDSLGGWEGTLKRVSYAYDGTRTIAVYKGTVYCYGHCAAHKDSNK